MIIVETTDDGRESRWRPEELLMDLQDQVVDGKLSREGFDQQIRTAFPGMTEIWYRDLFDEWCP